MAVSLQTRIISLPLRLSLIFNSPQFNQKTYNTHIGNSLERPFNSFHPVKIYINTPAHLSPTIILWSSTYETCLRGNRRMCPISLEYLETKRTNAHRRPTLQSLFLLCPSSLQSSKCRNTILSQVFEGAWLARSEFRKRGGARSFHHAKGPRKCISILHNFAIQLQLFCNARPTNSHFRDRESERTNERMNEGTGPTKTTYPTTPCVSLSSGWCRDDDADCPRVPLTRPICTSKAGWHCWGVPGRENTRSWVKLNLEANIKAPSLTILYNWAYWLTSPAPYKTFWNMENDHQLTQKEREWKWISYLDKKLFGRSEQPRHKTFKEFLAWHLHVVLDPSEVLKYEQENESTLTTIFSVPDWTLEKKGRFSQFDWDDPSSNHRTYRDKFQSDGHETIEFTAIWRRHRENWDFCEEVSHHFGRVLTRVTIQVIINLVG